MPVYITNYYGSSYANNENADIIYCGVLGLFGFPTLAYGLFVPSSWFPGLKTDTAQGWVLAETGEVNDDKHAQRLFVELDKNGDKEVTAEEMKRHATAFFMKHYKAPERKAQTIDDGYRKVVIMEDDREYEMRCKKDKEVKKSAMMIFLEQVDEDHNGVISIDELQKSIVTVHAAHATSQSKQKNCCITVGGFLSLLSIGFGLIAHRRLKAIN